MSPGRNLPFFLLQAQKTRAREPAGWRGPRVLFFMEDADPARSGVDPSGGGIPPSVGTLYTLFRFSPYPLPSPCPPPPPVSLPSPLPPPSPAPLPPPPLTPPCQSPLRLLLLARLLLLHLFNRGSETKFKTRNSSRQSQTLLAAQS